MRIIPLTLSIVAAAALGACDQTKSTRLTEDAVRRQFAESEAAARRFDARAICETVDESAAMKL